MFKKARLLLFLSLALLVMILSVSSVQTHCCNPERIKLAVFSDPHYFAPQYVSEGTAFSSYLAQDRKLLAESKAILSRAIDSIRRTDAQIVLITGDLTKDGEWLSHMQVASYLKQLKKAGKAVFVVPGNHDINNPHAVKYDGASTIPVKHITPVEFVKIYHNYGYRQAIARDPYSLSYVVEPISGLRIIAIDSCSYEDNLLNDAPTTHSGLKPQTLDWIKGQIKQAKVCNKQIIGMMHHGLMPHFSMEKALFSEFVIEDWENISTEFADLGMKVVFTGHFHAQDIIQKQTPNNNTIYDIETGSLVTYPCPYRIINLTNARMDIKTKTIQTINYDTQGKPFPTYAADFLNAGLSQVVPQVLTGLLIKQGIPANEAAAAAKQLAATQLAPSFTMLDLATTALRAHYIGDETSDAMIGNIISALQASPDPLTQMFGNIAYSLLNDSLPADNEVTLEL